MRIQVLTKCYHMHEDEDKKIGPLHPSTLIIISCVKYMLDTFITEHATNSR